ncbi:uncharacterized protein V1510DRAFT_418697 [Dipodascopsis tothii]|uniref:uncharacterized protein n=1 Tax=Dipodascopsis tothii TaxID=44089 RepID=UPI0034CDDC3C
MQLTHLACGLGRHRATAGAPTLTWAGRAAVQTAAALDQTRVASSSLGPVDALAGERARVSPPLYFPESGRVSARRRAIWSTTVSGGRARPAAACRGLWSVRAKGRCGRRPGHLERDVAPAATRQFTRFREGSRVRGRATDWQAQSAPSVAGRCLRVACCGRRAVRTLVRQETTTCTGHTRCRRDTLAAIQFRNSVRQPSGSASSKRLFPRASKVYEPTATGQASTPKPK